MWHGEAGRGLARLGGSKARIKARQGSARQGVAWPGGSKAGIKVRQGLAWRGMAGVRQE